MRQDIRNELALEKYKSATKQVEKTYFIMNFWKILQNICRLQNEYHVHIFNININHFLKKKTTYITAALSNKPSMYYLHHSINFSESAVKLQVVFSET